MTVINMCCIAGMKALPTGFVDAIVCDPPYELGFMGKTWDASGIAYSVEMWTQALRVLKPGGHLLAFSGSRTYHRMVCAIEDAGFEIRDQIMWCFGSGFPKSLDVSKAIDKAAGAEREVIGVNPNYRDPSANAEHHERWNGAVMSSDVTTPATDAARQWSGWGTALKPAHEPIVVARKPLAKGCTVAANVLAHGTGALNIDGCRVDSTPRTTHAAGNIRGVAIHGGGTQTGVIESGALGRWPANLIHDGSDEVIAAFPQAPGQLATASTSETQRNGSAARFFYCAKASSKDRHEGNTHPTVKPTDLMRYLCRLVTPPGGTVLDPFAGSGSTLKAAVLEGFNPIGFELSAEYAAIANARIGAARNA